MRPPRAPIHPVLRIDVPLRRLFNSCRGLEGYEAPPNGLRTDLWSARGAPPLWMAEACFGILLNVGGVAPHTPKNEERTINRLVLSSRSSFPASYSGRIRQRVSRRHA